MAPHLGRASTARAESSLPPMSGPRRVVVCVDGFYPMGGTEQQVVRLVGALACREHDVTLLSRQPLDETSAYVEEVRRAGVRIVSPGRRGEGLGRRHRLPMAGRK